MNWINSHKDFFINFCLIFASIILAAIFGEILLRMVLDNKTEYFIKDPVLLHTMVPGGDIDDNGFRNPDIPTSAEVVAIGDSQTYGDQASSDETWPSQLQYFSGLKVYNMGIGGYGPLQYGFLIKKALEFDPRIVIWGLYLGNDVFDAYYLPYERDEANAWVSLTDASVKEKMQNTSLPSFLHEEILPKLPMKRNSADISFSQKIRLFFRDHSVFYAFLGDSTRSLREQFGLAEKRQTINDEYYRKWAAEHPELGFVYEKNPSIKTVFTTRYRSNVLDLDDPRIAEGLRISFKLLKDAKTTLDKEGVHFLLAIIPTKETVYAERIERDGLVPGEEYLRLIANEERVKKRIFAFCEEEKIYCFDVMPALRAGLSADTALYASTSDGHPLANGYSIIAKAIDGFLKEKNLISL